MDDELEPVSYPDNAWFDAWRGVLYASARVLRVVDPALIADCGIPITWLDVLSQLNDAGGSLRIQELQEHSLFTRSGMTRLVDRVEEIGLVRREAVPGDRRGVLVALTAEGRQRLAEAMAPAVLWMDELDKAFAGANAYSGDSGTSARVLGTLMKNGVPINSEMPIRI